MDIHCAFDIYALRLYCVHMRYIRLYSQHRSRYAVSTCHYFMEVGHAHQPQPISSLNRISDTCCEPGIAHDLRDADPSRDAPKDGNSTQDNHHALRRKGVQGPTCWGAEGKEDVADIDDGCHTSNAWHCLTNIRPRLKAVQLLVLPGDNVSKLCKGYLQPLQAKPCANHWSARTHVSIVGSTASKL